ncbi:MAG: SURF1 family cytochrome oxidase biogenesis protein, partial [Allosphingosinicella sp.]
VVAAAVLTMIGLGIWQLQRAQWKDRLLAEYAAAASLPPLDLDPLLDRPSDRPLSVPMAYRRVLVTCSTARSAPQLRGGRSRDGGSGYAYFVPCRPGAAGLAGRLMVNVGWSPMPHEDLRLAPSALTAGTLGSVDEDRIVLTSATASPPLVASAASGPENIPNNHLLYAFQWFFFAAAAAVVYWLALRRRGRETLPPGA